jgi:hypothetical protein
MLASQRRDGRVGSEAVRPQVPQYAMSEPVFLHKAARWAHIVLEKETANAVNKILVRCVL